MLHACPLIAYSTFNESDGFQGGLNVNGPQLWLMLFAYDICKSCRWSVSPCDHIAWNVQICPDWTKNYIDITMEIFVNSHEHIHSSSEKGSKTPSAVNSKRTRCANLKDGPAFAEGCGESCDIKFRGFKPNLPTTAQPCLSSSKTAHCQNGRQHWGRARLYCQCRGSEIHQVQCFIFLPCSTLTLRNGTIWN